MGPPSGSGFSHTTRSMAMARLTFSKEELMRSHDYAAPQIIDGQRILGHPEAAQILPEFDAWADAR